MIATRPTVFTSRIYNNLPLSFSVSTLARRKFHDFAFVFDIDGVLFRGKKPIPQARSALELLNRKKVPYILMTNGGGISEKAKADEVTEITKCSLPISPLQVVQSHTPMKALTRDKNFQRVLVVGGKGDNARHVAYDYGFKDVVMPIDIVRANRAVAPHSMYTEDDFAKYSRDVDLSKPVDAILVFNDPRDMSSDIQIVQDVLNSQNGELNGVKRNFKDVKDKSKPAVPILFSNNDYVYANDYPLPRFGQGAFRIITESLYNHTNRLSPLENLQSLIMGKPFKLQYDFAHHVLIDWRSRLTNNELKTDLQILPLLGEVPESSPFKKIYMVGDNPESDIKGANDHGWESILLRTGVYKDEDWDYIVAKPTVGVFDNVEDAVKLVLEKNGVSTD
ncbi:conserved hypothetical protein [Lodderomyces elongisporus NRRL YB-4239]|uniref:TIGR01456 family HAD hydrolase n=1 Tax=Lodderomyces elongisporus (strain ATCC 11503 / CBS 2605 / JCM 1781 / NBRC 1676 / NRRL YB-4239) TaxID=379508 RepID=A5DWM4_LODEL|nr:conserved hypothetical protein [Lodderomyces elongisporus NRRL YB-4239]